MNKIENNNDAFPCSVDQERNPSLHEMSLRDWFAGLALSAVTGHAGWSRLAVAEHAYEIADAMIEKRGVK